MKKLQIGQRQASRICQMSAANRLAFIAEAILSGNEKARASKRSGLPPRYPDGR